MRNFQLWFGLVTMPIALYSALYWIGNLVEPGLAPHGGWLFCNIGSMPVGWFWVSLYRRRKSVFGRRLTLGYGLYILLVAGWVSSWSSTTISWDRWLSPIGFGCLINLVLFALGAAACLSIGRAPNIKAPNNPASRS